MQAAFFTRGKKRNSTSHPSGVVGGTLYDIVLKIPSSITRPTLVLRLPPSLAAPVYNYCYIESLGRRYYYIQEWRSVGVNWECDLTVDVLASYDTIILASTQTVLRSTVNPNLDITNTAVVAGLPETETQIIATRYTTDITQGTFVIAIANDDANSYGAASLYAMSYEWCGVLMQKLLGEIDWAGTITDISADLLKCLFDPLQYILSCRYYPVGVSFFTGDSPTAYTSIRLGHWLIDGVNNIPLTSTDVVKSDLVTSFTVNGHPAQSTYGRWLNYAPYYTAEVYIPPYGTFNVPAWALGQTIYCNITVDALTGQSVLQPYIGDTFLEPHTAQIGVDVPLAQLQPDIVGGFINSRLGKNPIYDIIGVSETSRMLAAPGYTSTGSMDGLSNNVASLINQALLGVLTSGGVDTQPDRSNAAAGSLCAVHRDAYVTRKYLPIDGDIIGKIGYPCFKTAQLSTFKALGPSSTYSVWVQCADPHIVIDTATADETAQIEAYLASGVYLE